MSEHGGSNWSGSLHPSQSTSQRRSRNPSGEAAVGNKPVSGSGGGKRGSASSEGSGGAAASASGTSPFGSTGGGGTRSVANFDARPDQKASGWMHFSRADSHHGSVTGQTGGQTGPGQAMPPHSAQAQGYGAGSGMTEAQLVAHNHQQNASTAQAAPARPQLQTRGASSPFASSHTPQSFTLTFSGRRSSKDTEVPGAEGNNGALPTPTSPSTSPDASMYPVSPVIRLAPPSDSDDAASSRVKLGSVGRRSSQQHDQSTQAPASASGSNPKKGPGAIPNFPGPADLREPPRSPSPTSSYASSAQFKAPAIPASTKKPSMVGRPSLGKLPSQMQSFSSASSGPVSPWHALAAASGAPTPSLDGPGRNSPMLGGPFERLNLEGSWSGANLFGGNSTPGAAPQEGQGQLNATAQPADTSGSAAGPARRPSAGAGMSADMLEKYRALAGRASATGSAGRHSSGSKVSGVSGGPGGTQDGDAMDVDPPAPGSAISASSRSSVGSGSAGSGGMGSGTDMKLTLPPALARRRGSLPPAGNSGLAPPSNRSSASIQSMPASSSPLAASSISASAQGSSSGLLKTLAPNDAPSVLFAASTLVLDLRPPSAFEAAHIFCAISVTAPSTLLRRPAFKLANVVSMLDAPTQASFNKWPSMRDIVFIDTDSLSAGEDSIIGRMAGKFEKEGFKGQVWFVRGGQAALMGVPAVKSKIIGSGEGEVGQQRSASTSPGPMAFSLGGSASSSRAPSFRSQGHGQAPMAATPNVNMRSNPFDGSRDGSATERPLSLRALNFSDTSSQVSGSSASSATQSGSGSGSGIRSGTGSGSSGNRNRSSKAAANPFFDNIRQNLELSHGGITERITLQLPSEARRRAHELPTWMSELVLLNDKAAADRLAHEFYTVELNEQKRLQAIMDYHSRESGAMLHATRIGETGGGQWKDQRDKDKEEVSRLEGWAQGRWHEKGEEYYPFSITAGIERGAKNRYKNIWPYDFSRVRLDTPADDESDYINASHVQPRGTSRRYIATQGPLDATYRDFWTLIWEQDVRVIVMLTKQYEGGMIKCGNYWQDENFGPLHVSLDSQTGGEDAAHPSQVSGFDFGMAAASGAAKSTESSAHHESVNIRRDFILRHDNHPKAGSRRIIQIQCVNWPDFDVPESPEVLLGVIRDVDQAVEEAVPRNRGGSGTGAQPGREADRCEQSPVLVHCSAGVGRTGSFIVVDSIIDALHREYESRALGGIDDAHHIISQSKVPSGAPTATSNAERHRVDSMDSHSSASNRSSKRNVSFSVPPPLNSAPLGSTSAITSPPETPDRPQTETPLREPAPRYWPSKQNTAQKLSSDADSKEDARIIEEQEGEEDRGMDMDQPASSSQPPTPARAARSYAPSPGRSSSRAPDPWSYRDNEGSVGDDHSETDSSVEHTGGRRPSLVSLTSDRNSNEQLPTINENPPPVTKSAERHRTPSPLRGMDNPVLDVLEGMRVQRMSLVQTLRQFVFVHRVIVAYYLGLLDDAAEQDRKNSKESSAETTDPRSSSIAPTDATDSRSTLASVSTAVSYSTGVPTSISSGTEGSEDEGPHKRRASPTELSPERRVSDLAPNAPSGGSAARPIAGVLQRRGSNKRIKQERKGLGEGFKMSPSPGPGLGSGTGAGSAPAPGLGPGSTTDTGSTAGSSAFGSSC